MMAFFYPFFIGLLVLAPVAPWANVNSMVFNGSTQYVDLGNNIGFERTDSFSLCLWLKPSVVTGAPTLIGKLSNGAFRGYLLVLNAAVPEFDLQNTYPTNRIARTGGSVMTSGAWQQLCSTYDGTSTAAGALLYRNAVALTMTTAANTLSATTLTTNNLYLAADAGAGTPLAEDFFNGKEDEITIWSGVLTSGNISTLYNSGHPANPVGLSLAATLTHYYRMGDAPDVNSGSGGVKDRVGSVNGTPIASPTIGTDVP